MTYDVVSEIVFIHQKLKQLESHSFAHQLARFQLSIAQRRILMKKMHIFEAISKRLAEFIYSITYLKSNHFYGRAI